MVDHFFSSSQIPGSIWILLVIVIFNSSQIKGSTGSNDARMMTLSSTHVDWEVKGFCSKCCKGQTSVVQHVVQHVIGFLIFGWLVGMRRSILMLGSTLALFLYHAKWSPGHFGSRSSPLLFKSPTLWSQPYGLWTGSLGGCQKLLDPDVLCWCSIWSFVTRWSITFSHRARSQAQFEFCWWSLFSTRARSKAQQDPMMRGWWPSHLPTSTER